MHVVCVPARTHRTTMASVAYLRHILKGQNNERSRCSGRGIGHLDSPFVSLLHVRADDLEPSSAASPSAVFVLRCACVRV